MTTTPEALAERFTVATDPAVLAGCELVIEAVTESAELKATVLSRVQDAAPTAVLATNTSSLSIDGLASNLSRPERFIGLHFFNPVPASDPIPVT